MPLPSKVVGVYWTRWNPQIRLTAVSQGYNLLYLFAATKAGGEGGLSWGQNDIAADIRTCRGRGQRVILSTGGAGQGINFWGREVSQRFVDSVVRINTELGGTLAAPALDGLDFNTFEADAAPNTPEYLWTAQELKRRFGAGFAITSPPAPWSQRDKDFCREMIRAGAMDYAAPQFYDGPGLADPGYIVRVTGEWVRDVAGGDASKIVVGYGMESLPNYSTIDQITNAHNQIKNAHPGIKGVFLWQHRTDSDRGWVFGNRMPGIVGASATDPLPPVWPPPPTSDNRPLVAVGGKTFPLSGTNVTRTAEALVLYTRTANQTVTPTNPWGAEVVVSNGFVQSVNDRQATEATAGTPIPAGSVVLSGHGAARTWLIENCRVSSVMEIPGISGAVNLSMPFLRAGTPDRGMVRTAQGLLCARGHKVAIDGSFGASTTTAVKAFQSAVKIQPSGVIDPETWLRLITG